MVLHFIRAVFLLAVLGLTFSVVTNKNIAQEIGLGGRLTLFMVLPVALAALIVLADMVWRRKNLQAISGLFFGLMTGLAIAYVLGLVVQLVAGIFPGGADSAITQMIRTLIGATTVYVVISFVMQTKDDFRFIIPYVEFAKQTRGPRAVLLDTSVIIDGRIAGMVDTEFFRYQLVIPRFVLDELQSLADSSDALRRNRGRRGLDVLSRLRRSEKADLRITDPRVREVAQAVGVDNKLVALAQHTGGRVMTNDYNLNKVAQLRGVEVMNINDLANALKTVVLPGESLSVTIIKPGEEPGQGVGYLADGTMVVVEQGRDQIGKPVQLVVTSVLQTSAGRMVFGRGQRASSGRGSGDRRDDAHES